jgi:hypothetical protein
MNFEIFMSKNNILEYSNKNYVFSITNVFSLKNKFKNYNFFENNVINVKDAEVLN